MKSENRILIAFILNLAFSAFECIGGILTGSVAILSDALHDMGDALGIGIAYFLEKKSTHQNDKYSIFSSILMSFILLVSSLLVISKSIGRFFHPVKINYDGMLLFAFIGICVNLCAAYFTHGGDSLNQKTVNLHMLEDVLGWAVVLIGAIIMKFTNFLLIDPLLSIGVTLFILSHAIQNLKEGIHLLRYGHNPTLQRHFGHHHH